MALSKEQLWEAALADLELNLSRANFTTWFNNTFLASIKDGQVVVAVPNGFTKEWLQNKYHKHIVQALKNIEKSISKVQYIVKTKTSKKTSSSSKTKLESTIHTNSSPTQIVNNGGLNPNYTFSNFIVGPSNELAHAAAEAIVKDPGKQYNPLFIYGGVGLGKTHLLQAIGNEVIKHKPTTIVEYTSSEKFTSELIRAIGQRKMDQFKDQYRKIDVLIIDDVQFLSGKEKTQEEFFHTFNALHQADKQIVLSSDRPPKAIPTLEERLRSRFEGGVTADIGRPELETRLAILKIKAKQRDFSIDDEITEYIATNIRQNIRELEGALNRLIAYCELNKNEPTLDIAKQVISSIIDNPQRRATTPRKVIDAVVSFYDVTKDQLLGRSRRKEVARARQVAMYLMREEINSSYPAIGKEVGGRDHTTAMHACNRIQGEIDNDEGALQELSMIKDKLFR